MNIKNLFGFAFSKIKLLVALVIGLFLLLVLLSLSGFSQVYYIIKNTSLGYVLLGFLTIAVGFFIRTWRWGILVRISGYEVSKDILFKSLMFGFFLNLFLPARAGDIARCAALKSTQKIPMGISLSTIVIERAMDMFILALLLIIGMMFLPKNKALSNLAGISVIIAFLLIGGLIFINRYDKFIFGKFEKKFPIISIFIKSMKEGAKKMYYNPIALFYSIVLSFPVWVFEIFGTYLAAKAIGSEISVSLAMVVGITSFLSQTIPLTPAGIGIYEGTMAGVFELFGISLTTGISIALVDHFMRVTFTIIFGVISTIYLGPASRACFLEIRKIRENF